MSRSFEDFFDSNHDGKIDSAERVTQYYIMDEMGMADNSEESDEDEFEDEEFEEDEFDEEDSEYDEYGEDDLTDSDPDYDDLEFMDEDERDEAMEDAGFDSDDYDF